MTGDRALARDAGFSRVAVPADVVAQSATFRRCLYSLRNGRLDAAEALCRETLDTAPASASLWHLFGILAARGGRLDEAVARLSQALAIAPDAVPVLLDRAALLPPLGRLDEAVADYDRAVALAPAEAQAWHRRGLVLAALGRHEEALASHDRALLGRPADAEIEAARGDALRRLDRPGDALACYDRALALAPNSAEAHNGRGLALAALGRTAAALASLARALVLRPGYAEAHLNSGDVLRATGRNEEAVYCYDRALDIAPTLADALHNRALALADLGRLEDAIESYDRALAAAPDLASALIGKGLVLSRLDRQAEALDCFDLALAVVPDSAEAKALRADVLEMLRESRSKAEVHFLRGDTFRLLERWQEAVAAYDAALALRPEFAEAWNNRGKALDGMHEPFDALASYGRASQLRPEWADPHINCCGTLRSLGRGEEALAAADRAVALDPQSPAAFNGRGNALLSLGRPDDAIDCFDRAIALRPAASEPRFNRAVALLLTGDYARGWAEYEARWTMGDAARRIEAFIGRRAWLGDEDIAGRTIVLHAEQGYGDTIQFCRYVPLVAARGASIVLGVPPLLAGLLGSLEGSPRIVHRPETVPDFDLHCGLMSLPYAFRTTLETIPAAVPYLAAPAEPRRLWRQRLADSPRPRIGLAWSGNATHKDDYNRSIALDQLQPILELGLPFYALQRQLRPADMPALAMFPNLRFCGPELGDFGDTAALIDALDLVISVDTASAHLAGALARPVWLMLSYAADFRWMTERDDSPWYPTMRLFRQPRPGDWAAVIERIRSELSVFRSTVAAQPGSSQQGLPAD